MKKVVLLLLTCFASIAFVSCSNDDAGGTSSPLTAYTWKCYGFGDVGSGTVTAIIPQDDNSFLLKFDADGSFHGKSAVNTCTGEYTISGKQLQISHYSHTMMGAPNTDEDKYNQIMGSSIETFAVSDNLLRLYYNNGQEYLLFGKYNEDASAANDYIADKSLLCQSWQWQCIGYGNEASFHEIPDSLRNPSDDPYRRFLVRFSPDGSIRGQDAVNGFLGTYRCDGSRLAIEDVFVTQIYDPHAEESRQFTQHLVSAIRYGIKDGRLLRIYYSETEYLLFEIIKPYDETEAIVNNIKAYLGSIPTEDTLYYVSEGEKVVLTPKEGYLYYVNVRDEEGLRTFNIIREEFTHAITNVTERTPDEDYIVESAFRIVHPAYYVSDIYTIGDTEVAVLPEITLKLKDGVSVDDILKKYPMLTVKENASTDEGIHVLAITCSTSVELMRTVMDIQMLDAVEWVEPNMFAL